MSAIKILAVVCLVLWIIWNVAFYAEGHKTQGSMGLRTVNFAAELSYWTLLIWLLAR